MKTNLTLGTITILVIVLSILTSCKKDTTKPIEETPINTPKSIYWQGGYKATVTRDNSNVETYPWTSLSKYDIAIYMNGNTTYENTPIGTKITIPRKVQTGASDTLSIYNVKPEVTGNVIDKTTIKLNDVQWSVGASKHKMCKASIILNPNDNSLVLEYTDSTINTATKYFSHYKLILTKN